MDRHKLLAAGHYAHWLASLRFWMEPERIAVNDNGIVRAVSGLLQAAKVLGIEPSE